MKPTYSEVLHALSNVLVQFDAMIELNDIDWHLAEQEDQQMITEAKAVADAAGA